MQSKKPERAFSVASPIHDPNHPWTFAFQPPCVRLRARTFCVTSSPGSVVGHTVAPPCRASRADVRHVTNGTCGQYFCGHRRAPGTQVAASEFPWLGDRGVI